MSYRCLSRQLLLMLILTMFALMPLIAVDFTGYWSGRYTQFGHPSAPNEYVLKLIQSGSTIEAVHGPHLAMSGTVVGNYFSMTRQIPFEEIPETMNGLLVEGKIEGAYTGTAEESFLMPGSGTYVFSSYPSNGVVEGNGVLSGIAVSQIWSPSFAVTILRDPGFETWRTKIEMSSVLSDGSEFELTIKNAFSLSNSTFNVSEFSQHEANLRWQQGDVDFEAHPSVGSLVITNFSSNRFVGSYAFVFEGGSEIEGTFDVPVIDSLFVPNDAIPVTPTGIVSSARQPLFDWSESNYADLYEFEILWHGIPLYSTSSVSAWRPPYMLPYGNYTWRVRALGSEGTSAWSGLQSFSIESSEGNGRADFVITDFSLIQQNILDDDAGALVDIVIQNVGDVGGYYGALMLWRDTFIGMNNPEVYYHMNCRDGYIDPGETIQLQTWTDVAIGEELHAHIDYLESTTERCETNNHASFVVEHDSFGDPASSDLYLGGIDHVQSIEADIYYMPRSLVGHHGSPVSGTYVIRNWAHKVSVANVGEAGDRECVSSQSQPIGSIGLAMTSPSAPGSYTFRSFIDADGDVLETYENNNQAAKVYSVIAENGKPDLVLSRDYSFPVYESMLGVTNNYTIYVKNIGQKAANGFAVGIWPDVSENTDFDDPAPYIATWNDVLAPGFEQMIQVPIYFPHRTNTGFMAVKLDITDANSELNEYNNLTFRCYGPDFWRSRPSEIVSSVIPSQALIAVNANPLDGGTVSGGGTYSVGSQQQLSASANTNWHFVEWNDGSTQNPRTITVPVGGASYTAYFEKDQAMISVSASPAEGGDVTGGGLFDVGSLQQLEAVHSVNWHFVEWADGAIQNPRTISVPATGSVFTALFARDQAEINVFASPEDGGSVFGAGTYAVGSQQYISCVESDNWYFTAWQDGNAYNPRMIVVPPEGANYTAYFQREQAAISVSANPLDAGYILGGGRFGIGTEQQLEAVTNAGWRFVQWEDGATQNPRNILVPPEGATYEGWFERTPVSLTLLSSPTNGGDVYGTGIYGSGTEQAVFAQPRDYWFFLGWQDGNTENPRNIVIALSNQIYRGYFAPKRGSLQVNLRPPEAVSAGAFWKVDGGAWHSSTASIENLLVSQPHLVECLPIPGWNAPAPLYEWVDWDRIKTVNRYYQLTNGMLQVFVEPQEAIDAGAGWYASADCDKAFWVIGGGGGNHDWLLSGASVVGLSSGDYEVDFRPLEGWSTPELCVDIVDSGLLVVTGRYSSCPLIEIDPLEFKPAVPLGRNHSDQKFYIAKRLSETSGPSMEYQISVDEVWLDVLPDQGILTNGRNWIHIDYDVDELPLGTYTGHIGVVVEPALSDPFCKATSNEIAVVLEVTDTPPTLNVGTNVLHVYYEVYKDGNAVVPPRIPPDLFEIWNSGQGRMDYVITSDESWVFPDVETGWCEEERDVITVSYNPKGLTAGVYNATLTIVSASAVDSSPKTIDVVLTIVDGGSMKISPFVEPYDFYVVPKVYSPFGSLLFEVGYKVHYQSTYFSDGLRNIELRINVGEKDWPKRNYWSPVQTNHYSHFREGAWYGITYDEYFPETGYFTFDINFSSQQDLFVDGDLEWMAGIRLFDNGFQRTWNKGKPYAVSATSLFVSGNAFLEQSTKDEHGVFMKLETLNDAEYTSNSKVNADSVSEERGGCCLPVDVLSNVLAQVLIIPEDAHYDPPKRLSIYHRLSFGNPSWLGAFFKNKEGVWQRLETDYHENDPLEVRDDCWTALITNGGQYAFCFISSDDMDLDGISDQWEDALFGNGEVVHANSDLDADGLLDLYEALAGTNPTNPLSYIGIKAAGSPSGEAGDSMFLEWYSVSNKSYNISAASNIEGPFEALATNIPATPPHNYYRLSVPHEHLQILRVESE